MKKTLLPIFLSFILIFSLSSVVSAASGNLTAGGTLSKDGTSFTVDLSINNNPGFIAVTASVSYDDTVLKLTAADNGEIFESIFMPSEYLTVNPYKIIWMNATASKDIKTNGVLAKYTFEVLDSAALGETEIKFNIDEVVNYEKTDTTSIKSCTFKINVDGISEVDNTGDENTVSAGTENISDNSSANASANNAATNSNTLVVKKPQPIDNSDEENISLEADTQEAITMVSSDELATDGEIGLEEEKKSSKTEESDKDKDTRSTVTIVTVAAILLAGVLITLIAIYFRKKSGQSKNSDNQ